jgi:hypothetical protein
MTNHLGNFKIGASLTVVLTALGCGGVPDAPTPTTDEADVGTAVQALSARDFDVNFSGCAEFAGIGQVPFANARPLVPSHYALAGDGAHALLVVRVSHCSGTAIDGYARGDTTVSQIGISVIGQDPTADINNYTLAYVTDQAALHLRFIAAGLDADRALALRFGLSKTGMLDVASLSLHTPAFQVQGFATPPSASPVTFVASWWADGSYGVVRSRTTFPAIRFGTSTVTLTTPARSTLGKLIGGTSFTFALLDSYNTFANAHMEVRDTD